MQVFEKIKSIIKNAFTQGWTAKKLALSFSMGIYTAFSPLPGVHTAMMFLFKWLFKLNFPILFIATSFNNPWTMVPFYTLDYVFGYWFLHVFLKINPSWTISLAKIFGSGKICVWSFLVGGNILGLFFGLLTYPVIYFLFKNLLKKFKKDYENNK
ncbi:MAG: hypothetical protein SZ59_C0003G0033 [candidate division TM6 bacterium GW2011_GWF2_28_16]|nr:MAG: hypothetical protein SZ59_C0003G0033 [candidate division TM6 bacterium GW2011_GWF2_28_16]